MSTIMPNPASPDETPAEGTHPVVDPDTGRLYGNLRVQVEADRVVLTLVGFDDFAPEDRAAMLQAAADVWRKRFGLPR